jgi:hypothetical protein
MDERDPNELSAEERRALSTLPRTIEPARDLWPEIARRIAVETRDEPARTMWPGGRWLQAAAIAIALLGGGVLLGRLGGRSERAPIVAETAAPAEETPRSLLPTDEEWAAASSQVLASLADSTSGMDPATAEVVRRNLEIIDAAVRDIQEALEADPSNPQLQKLLTAEYRRRSALMRRATTDTPM